MSEVQTQIQTLRVNSSRLWNSIHELAKIGATEKGGVRRLALTDLDRQGRDLVVGWFKDAGLQVRVDGVGNIFARRPGTGSSRAAIATGSHIDTQPSGGKFDGNYGVLAGLEVVRTLNEAQIETEAPIEICVWTNEEGSRFTPVLMGSGAWAKIFTPEFIWRQVDQEGKSVGDELRKIGYAGSAPVGPSEAHPAFAAYFEAHIEQGPVLEDADLPIGVVTGALGQRWFDVVVTGMDAHAGPTPMELRKDALLAASGLVIDVNAAALTEAPEGRGTVGFMQVIPNSRNVIPGCVRFSVEFRHPTMAGVQRMESLLRAKIAALNAQGRVSVEMTLVSEYDASHFDSACVDAVRQASKTLGLPSMEVVSGAAHDAVCVSRHSPTAMIFIPCKDGISHNEIEDARQDHVEAGANVLLLAMLERAVVV